MKIIKTNTYDIHIEHGVFNRLFDVLNVADNQNVFVVVDARVETLYQQALSNVFGDNVHLIKVPQGERSKSLNTYQHVLSALLEHNVVKTDLLIALGGGVIGDLTGFVAATLFRGMAYVQIPTTLLAMVDSSIGGKTALNLSEGKNLIGSFHEPNQVIIDPAFLKTLPAREINSGMVEMVKAALIKDHDFYLTLKEATTITSALIHHAITIKKAVVEADFYDQHHRHILNFGHTFGHAIEQHFQYQVSHGEAVAMGIKLALKLGFHLGFHPQALLDEITTLFDDKRLITYPEPKINDLMPYLVHDKKIKGSTINFVFIKSIGEAFIEPLDLEVIRHAFD